MSGLKVDAGYGRLYVTGPSHRVLSSLPGATENVKRGAMELSLTLETLKAIKQKMQWTSEQLAACCTPAVMAWAHAAARSERSVTDMHRKLATGWRQRLPWHDAISGFRPFAHQEVMATVACMLDGTAFWCDMGTGKTRAALEAAGERVRRGELDYIIVFCPARVMPVWQRETMRWTRNLTPEVLTGNIQKRLDKLRVFAASSQPAGTGLVLILNYEVVSRMDAGLLALMESQKCGLIIDESHKIKNASAQVTKSVLKLVRAAHWRLALSGTPHTGKDTDVWSQWYCVDLGVGFGASYPQFKREFFTENAYTFELVPKQGTADILRHRMARRGLRYRKVDCLDLPPKMYETIIVQMTREQRNAYEDMAELLVAKLDNGEFANASTALVAMMRLAQITSGFVKQEDGSLYRFPENPKLAACIELVNELIEQGQSVIIWAWYIEDIDRLLNVFAHHHPATVRGGQKLAEHAEAETRFQSRATKLLIANQASGGTGITLTAASAAVYYSQGYSMTDRTQSEDRCHRAGSEQHEKITYYDLQCAGSVDTVIASAIGQKLDSAALVVEIRESLTEGVTA